MVTNPKAPKAPPRIHHAAVVDPFVSDSRKLIQSKHVPEVPILRSLAALPGGETANLEDILNHRSGYPVKAVKERLNSLIRRKLITGCTCGCRGEFAITEAGKAALTAEDESREYRRVS